MRDIIRQIDRQIVFRDDPDVPHYTFVSPIRWAPWLETIWFGNLYDYRSAYFHDVMYSNNVPYKEGALLYKDVKSNTNMGLLYQRYLKFDTESYSLANCTLYNIFGEKSVRLGRYKLPLTSTAILSVTDPLTYTEMKRYLASFNMIKWFTNQYLQAKRKRSYKLDVKSDTFLYDAIQRLEYGRITSDTSNINSPVRIPIVPIDSSTQSSMLIAPIPRIRDHTDHISTGLTVAMTAANSQYFIENLIQSILLYEEQVAEILVGGDGRIYNTHVIDIITRVASANRVQRVLVPPNALMTTSIAKTFQNKKSLAMVLTAAGNAAGIRGYFGMRVISSNGIEYDEYDWENVRSIMASNRHVNIIPGTSIARIHGWVGDSNILVDKMAVTSVDVIQKYITKLRSTFNFTQLKEGLVSNGVSVVIDNCNTYLVTMLTPVINELGTDNFLILDTKSAVDYGDQTPNPSPISRTKAMQLFNVYTPLHNIRSIDDAGSDGNDSDDEKEGDAPDIGFVFDADGNNCMVLTPGAYVANSEDVVRELNVQYGLSHDYKDDAVYTMLNWLQLLVTINKDSSKPYSNIQSIISQVLPEKRAFMSIDYAISDDRCYSILDLLRGLNTTLVYSKSGQFVRVLDGNAAPTGEDESFDIEEEDDDDDTDDADTDVYMAHSTSSDFILVNSSRIFHDSLVPSAYLLANHTDQAVITLITPDIDPDASVDVLYRPQKGLTLTFQYKTSINMKKIDQIFVKMLHKMLIDGKIQDIGATQLADGSLTARSI